MVASLNQIAKVEATRPFKDLGNSSLLPRSKSGEIRSESQPDSRGLHKDMDARGQWLMEDHQSLSATDGLIPVCPFSWAAAF